MNITRVRASNFRSYPELDIALPHGCVAVVGDNGAGKSSLVETIPVALFGPRTGRTLAPYLFEDGGDACMVEVEFEHTGERYRVRRGYSAAGRGKSTLDFERQSWTAGTSGTIPGTNLPEPAALWSPLTRETAAATQAEIERTLGLTRTTFTASAFLSQGDGAAFPEADPRERKQVLSEILGLDRFEGWLAAVKADRRKVEDELVTVDSLIGSAEAELVEKAQVENALAFAIEAAMDAKKKLGEAEAQAGTLQQSVAKIERQQSELAAARAERDAAEERLRGLERIEREAKVAAEQLVEARKRLGTLPTQEQVERLVVEEAELETADRGYQALIAADRERRAERELKTREHDAMIAQADDLYRRASESRRRAEEKEAAGPGEQTCDHCGQTLNAEALASEIAKLRAEADEDDAAARDLTAQAAAIEIPELPPAPPMVEPPSEPLSQVRVRLQSAREGLLERAGLEGQVPALEQSAARLGPDFTDELRVADEAVEEAKQKVAAAMTVSPSALAEAQAELAKAREAVATHQQRVSETIADRARLEEAQKRLANLEQTVAGKLAEREDLQIELDVLHVLEGAYGQNGLPVQRIEEVLPQIETEADGILQKLGTTYRVELRTERAKKGGGTAETLDVVVSTDAGERPYETFSGGERTRINLALRLSLARLLAHRRGAESRLLVVDEPEFLDAAGTAALAEVLRGLESDFDSILLVSHVPDLRDAFEQALVVQRNGAGSEVVAA